MQPADARELQRLIQKITEDRDATRLRYVIACLVELSRDCYPEPEQYEIEMAA